MSDTICALATAPGRAAIAVIRITGPGTKEALAALGVVDPKPRQASVRGLRAADGSVMDRALTLWFPAPRSYTGEHSAELHLHGGPGVVDRVMMRLLDHGLRLARAGEFTRRAFENGKLRLDQAEAVGDLIDSETAAQARQAMGQLDGALGRRHLGWRSALVRILSHLEAAVDFPDDDIPAEVEARARAPIEGIVAELDAALADSGRGERIRGGYRIAVVGAPNAGKSTLTNLLTARPTSIVAAAPGTTRDVVEATVMVAGYRVLIADTAGVRETADEVEAEGVRRARDLAGMADLRIWVVDRSSAEWSWRLAAELARPGDLAVLNKCDLPAAAGIVGQAEARALGLVVWTGSLRDGLDSAFWALVEGRVVRDLGGSDFPATTRVRHVEHLTRARDHLSRAVRMLRAPELASEDVRLALRELAMVTGEVGVEDVLDEVFASFCIGK